MIVAMPMPPPMHSVDKAVVLFERSSSSSTVPRIIAPVAPNGCADRNGLRDQVDIAVTINIAAILANSSILSQRQADAEI